MEHNHNTTSSPFNKGIGGRLGAAIIDGLIFIFLTIIVGTVLDYSHITTVFNLDYSQLNIITFIISACYFVYFEAVYGQTLGKKIFKLKVVNLNATTAGVGWGKAIIRNILKLFVLCYFASISTYRAGEVSGVYALFSALEIFVLNKSRQGWYDVLANTMVVQNSIAVNDVSSLNYKKGWGSKIFAVIRFVAVFVAAILFSMSMFK